MKLSGKVAVVTGAASGIGRATARRAAAEGAAVVCADIADPGETVSQIAGEGGRAAVVEHDVRRAESWARLVDRARSELGPIDLLANVAGIVASGTDTAIDQDEAEWDRVLETNLKGTWLGMRSVLPGMVERGRGAIVNIASEAALIGIPGLLSYTASKGGVAGLTRQVAIEYVKQGVTVNAIAPGFIRTAIQDGMDQALLDDMAAGIPIGRFGAPEDIAASVVHLFSADGAYITGQVLAVDGGWGVA
jgi:NAD(P)-dependent dehydrogenase (short-subunit alcohol dehydrogenase family)